MFCRSSVKFLFVAGAAVLSSSDAHAVTLADAAQVRPGFNFPNGDVSNSSYDGPAFDGFESFASFVSPEMLKVNSFTGQPLGSSLEFTLLSEAACFDGSAPSFANKFGVVNENGDFVSVLDTKVVNPGATGTLAQGADETFKFALQSPESLFTTDDASNADGAAHILAMKVNKSGEFVVDPTTLHGTPPLKFNFLEGDLVLFIEDLLAFGNLTASLVPSSGDFDYNDFVVVVRQTQVPEPASMALLGFGLLGAARMRRKQKSA